MESVRPADMAQIDPYVAWSSLSDVPALLGSGRFPSII